MIQIFVFEHKFFNNEIIFDCLAWRKCRRGFVVRLFSFLRLINFQNGDHLYDFILYIASNTFQISVDTMEQQRPNTTKQTNQKWHFPINIFLIYLSCRTYIDWWLISGFPVQLDDWFNVLHINKFGIRDVDRWTLRNYGEM